MFWKKKKIEKEQKYINELIIYFKDNSHMRSWQEIDKEEYTIKPWISFYKWFFGRPQSEHYVGKAWNSECLIKRSDIKTFKVRVRKKED
jgi:hypothetical protein